MSVLEIEKEVFKLPLTAKKDLSSWLLDLLEEEEDTQRVRCTNLKTTFRTTPYKTSIIPIHVFRLNS